MRNRRRSLPHPVLTPLTDDVEPNIFSFNCGQGDITSDLSRWRIIGRIEHDNETIAEHVERHRASYGIHVECPRTFFRKWFPQSSAEVSFEIPADAIAGRVELSAFCLATSDIKKYRIKGQHRDYSSTDFTINAGDVLAYAETIEFDAFLDVDPIRKISSILDIKRSDDRDSGPALIDFNGQRIEVELSKIDYAVYIDLRSDPGNKGLLASNVVFPAILQTLNFTGRLTEEELENLKNDTRWCRSLIAKLQGANLDVQGTQEEVFKTAQLILREPVRRGLGDLAARIGM